MRVVAGAASATLAVLTLAGCSLYPEPPAELKQEAAALAESVQALPGIRSAEATVLDVDFKDKPGEWYIQLTADAETPDDINRVPPEFALVLDGAQWGDLSIQPVLRIPGGLGVATVNLGILSDGTVQTAKALRSNPGIFSVDGASFKPRLYASIDASATLTTMVPVLRDAIHDGGDVVPSVLAIWNEQESTHHISVDVSPTWPSARLITALQHVGQLSSMNYLSAPLPQEGETVATIFIDLTDPADVPAVSSLLGEVSDNDTATPVHFWIYSPDGAGIDGTI